METISKWEKDAEETRKSLDEGNGITFPTAEEAIKWLKVGDTTHKTVNPPSH